MTLNEIMGNEKLLKFLENCIGKTYNKYSLFKMVDIDDFKQDTYLFIMKRIKNFDDEKASIKTYIPLLVISSARAYIQKAKGQSTNYNRLEIENSQTRLDNTFQYNEGEESLYNFISDGKDLESDIINNLTIHEIINSNYLNDMQKNILRLMLKGNTITRIAEILECSQANIHRHFKNAKNKILINM